VKGRVILIAGALVVGLGVQSSAHAAAGRFRVALAPGAYELRPSTTASFVYARPVDTQVRPHRFTPLTLRFYPRHPPPVAALVG
jgi:hypothetical protein